MLCVVTGVYKDKYILLKAIRQSKEMKPDLARNINIDSFYYIQLCLYEFK